MSVSELEEQNPEDGETNETVQYYRKESHWEKSKILFVFCF